MIIEIPDNPTLPLIDKVKIQLVIIAAKNCNTRNDMAKFIGISIRTLREWLRTYEELKELYRPPHKSNSPYWDDNPSWYRKC